MSFDLQTIVNVFASIPPDVLLQLLGGAFGISALQQGLKVKLESGTRKLSDSTNILVTVALVAAATAFAQFEGLIAASPEAFGGTGAVLYTVTHWLYKVGVKPFSLWFGKLLQEARELKRQKTADKVPLEAEMG